MAPRWVSSFDPSPRDAALLAEVLSALQSQLAESSGEEPSPPDVQELIIAAVAELHRVSPAAHHLSGVAPVLGSGVVQELLRRTREGRPVPADDPEPTVDERL